MQLWNLFHEDGELWGTSISRRDDSADAGYICGQLNANSIEGLFILSPIGEPAADRPDRNQLSIRPDDDGIIFSWPETVTAAALEISGDLLTWDGVADFQPSGSQHFFPFDGKRLTNYFRLRYQEE